MNWCCGSHFGANGNHMCGGIPYACGQCDCNGLCNAINCCCDTTDNCCDCCSAIGDCCSSCGSCDGCDCNCVIMWHVLSASIPPNHKDRNMIFIVNMVVLCLLSAWKKLHCDANLSGAKSFGKCAHLEVNCSFIQKGRLRCRIEKRNSFGGLSTQKARNGMSGQRGMKNVKQSVWASPSFLRMVFSIGFPQLPTERERSVQFITEKQQLSQNLSTQDRNNMCDQLVLCQFYFFCPCCAEKARDYCCGTHCGGKGDGDGCCCEYWIEYLRNGDCCGGTTLSCCLNNWPLDKLWCTAANFLLVS